MASSRGPQWDGTPGQKVATLAAFVACALISGTSFMVTKQATEEFPAVTLTALRLLLGGLALTVVSGVSLAFGWTRGFRAGLSARTESFLACSPSQVAPEARWYVGRNLGLVALAGTLNCAIPYTIYAVVLPNVNVGVAAVLASTTPMFGTVGERVFYDVALTGRKVAGLLLGLLGAVAVSSEKLARTGHWSASAYGFYLLLLFGAMCKAAASMMVQRQMAHMGFLSIAWGQTVCGAAVTVPVAVVVDYAARARPFTFGDVTWAGVACVAYLAFLGSCLVYILQFYLVSRFGSVRQLAVDLAVPLVAVVESIAFLHEWGKVSDTTKGMEGGGVSLLLVGLYLVLFPIRLLQPPPYGAGGAARAASSDSLRSTRPLVGVVDNDSASHLGGYAEVSNPVDMRFEDDDDDDNLYVPVAGSAPRSFPSTD